MDEDLSHIREASRTMNEEDELVSDDAEFATVQGPQTKRQHVSNNPKEQSESER